MKTLRFDTNKIRKASERIVKTQSKTFASGHEIDPHLKDFDVAFVGGLNAANVLKYMQHTNFHGTMAGFNPNATFFNQHHYEHLIHGNIKPFKYLAMGFNNNFDSKASLYVPQRVANIIPEKNQIVDSKGTVYSYKALVLNTGLSQKVQDMDFVNKYVSDGEFAESRVFAHQPHDEHHNERNKRIFSMHKDKDFLIYLPKYPSKREAYDAWYLAVDTYLSWGIQSQAHSDKIKIRVITPNKELFKMPFANEVVMDEISQRSMIETHFGYELTNIEVNETGVNAKNRYATFRNTETGQEMRMPFGTLLLTPENKKNILYENNDLADSTGQVTVNPYTLQHSKYPNVFAFGDCCNAPTTKSLYATLNQGVVVRNNLTDYLHGNEFKAVYEGYSSFAVNHSMDRQWIFSHKYDYTPSEGNFYVPRWLGLFAYKFKSILEKEYFGKIYNSKPNHGYPYISKNRYFRPLEENNYLKKNNISKDKILIHPIKKPELSTDHHHHDKEPAVSH